MMFSHDEICVPELGSTRATLRSERGQQEEARTDAGRLEQTQETTWIFLKHPRLTQKIQGQSVPMTVTAVSRVELSTSGFVALFGKHCVSD